MDLTKLINEALTDAAIDNIITDIDAGQFDRKACLRLIDRLYKSADPTEDELEAGTDKSTKLHLRELLASIKSAETSDVARDAEVEAIILLGKILERLEAKDRKQFEIEASNN